MAAAGSAEPRALAVGALGRLPLAFEPNTGQAPADVRYLSRGARLHVALTPTEARFSSPPAPGREPVTMRLRLAGDVRMSAPVAEDVLPGRVHYFAGRDPSAWRRNVPTYRRVVYRGVYPGTDLVFHGSQREAEFDFVLAPDADPGAIRLELDGADRVALDGDDVVARGGEHELRLRKPVVYQEADTGRIPVDGRFTVAGRGIAFEVGDYDRGRPLVIDPVVTYSTYVGDAGDQHGRAIGVDAAGNVYVSVDGMGIVKLSADGATLLYTTVLGDATMRAIAVDGPGHAYLAGTWPHPRSGAAFQYPTTANALRPSPGTPCFQGSSDGVMAKLGPDGSLLYSSFVGGNCLHEATGIAIDPAGNFYVTGFGSTTGGFPATRPPFAPASGTASTFPGWVQAVAADFSRYLYSVQILAGEGTLTEPIDIAADASGNAYVVGRTGAGFPTTPGAFQTGTGGGFESPFVAKIAPDGSRLVYASHFGGASTRILAVTVDAAGNAYLAGHSGTGLPTLNALQPALAGGADAFVAKLNVSGTGLAFSSYLGGGADDAAVAVGLDSAGNVYVAGPTDSIDFPQRDPLPPQFAGAGSNFVTALAPSGTALVYSTYFADTRTFLSGMAAAPNGTVHVTGGTRSTSFPTVRPYQPAFGGGSEFGGDAFIARIEPGSGGGTIRVFITAPAENATVSGTAWLTVWIEHAAAGSKTYTLSEGTTTVGRTTTTSNGPVSLAWPTTGGPNGARTVTVSVRDTGGNTGAGSRAFNVQNAGGGGLPALAASLTSPAAGATVTGTVAVGMAAVNPSGTPISFTLAVDGGQVFTVLGTATTASYQWNTGPLSNGAHTLALTVRDGAGRTATTTRTVTVANAGGGGATIRVFITAPAKGATVSGTAWLTVWIENAAAGAKTYTLSEGTTTVGSTSTSSNGPVSLAWPTTGGPNGSRTVTASLRDASGNTGAASRAFNVQNAGGGGGPAPLGASFTSPAEGATVSGTVTVGMAASNASGTPISFTLAVDGAQVFTTSGTATTASFAWNTAALSAGAHTLTLTVRDGAGRTATATRTATVGGGGTPIRVFITAPSNGATVRGTVWFTVWIEGAAAGSRTYTLAVGGTNVATTTTTSSGPVSMAWTTTAADNGSRAATVTVRDGAGNSGSATITLAVAN